MQPNTAPHLVSGDISSYLYSVLEYTDEIFFTLNEDTIISQTNRNISLLGYTKEEFVGKSLLEIIHPDDLPGILTFIADCVPSNKAAKDCRYRALHRNGTWRWINSSAMPVFDAGGNFLFITGLARDITAQVEQEVTVQENEAKYRQLFYHHPMPQWIADAQTLRFLEVNEAALNHYGYSRNEFLGMSLHHIITPNEAFRLPKADSTCNEAKKELSQLSGVWHHCRKNGDIIEVETKLQITSIKGQEAFLYTINDITEKRKAERELEASEQRYRLFIQQSSGGVWRFDLREPMPLGKSKEEIIEHFYKNCYLAECNDAMAKMYGLECKEDLIGKDCEFFLPSNEPASLAFFEEFIENNFRVKNSVSYEKDIHGNPKIFLNNYAAYIEDGYIIRTWGTQRDITEMHQAEEKVKYLAAIVENASDAIFSCDTERHIISWNKACEELFHFSAEEVIGKILSTIVHFEFPTASYMEAFTKVHKEGSWKGEVQFVNKFGKRVIMLISISCVKNEKGLLTGYILIFKDITERKQAEQNIRESEERFRRLADTAPVMIWMTNEENRPAYYNQTLLTFTGRTIEEELQMGWKENLHPADRDVMDEKVQDAWAKKESYSLEYRLRRHDGQYRWVIDRATPRFLEDGTFKGFIGISLDIHDRKTAEEQLLVHSTRNTKILNSITDGFIALDNDGTIIMWNQKMEEVYGLAAEEVIGKPLISAFDAYEDTEIFGFFKEAYKTKKHAHMEQFLPEQNMWVEIIIYPFNDGYFIYFKDISVRKRKALLMQLQKDVLSFNAAPGTTLADTARFLMSGIQTLLPDIKISLLKADENEENLYPLASNNLPVKYTETIQNVPIGPAVGSCGTAAFIKQPVISSHIPSDPLWMNYRELMQEVNLLAASSFPIVNSSQKVLAVLAMYYEQPHEPQEYELEIIDHILPVLSMIMEKRNADEDIRLSNERFTLVNKATNEAIIDSNLLTGKTIYGDGFKRLFGYDPAGNEPTPAFWISKVHSEDRPMIQQIEKNILSAENTLIKGIEFRLQKADGSYAFLSATGYIVRDEAGKPVRVVGAMRDITEQKKMEQKLIREMMNKQRAIHRASLEGSEKEREVISKELHDNVNQILSATKLFMEIAHKDEDKREMFMEKSIYYIKNVINEIRKLSRSLASPTLGDLGLKAAIETLVQEIHQTEKLNIDFHYSGDLEPNFDDTMNLTLYRIVQEQLTNILKYAQTKTTSIQLKKKKNNLVLTIKDDGVGFDKNKVKRGLGLSNITNRASLMNGTVSIKTAPGKGCSLEVTIPLNQVSFHKEHL